MSATSGADGGRKLAENRNGWRGVELRIELASKGHQVE
jgi:hypothetical protein